MNELDTMKQFVSEKNANCYGLATFLVFPDGRIYEYSRILDRDTLEKGPFTLLQFYGDDMMFAFQKAVSESLPDTEAKSSEDSSFHKEADLNTGSSESFHGSPDTSEEMGESEGGQNPTDND